MSWKNRWTGAGSMTSRVMSACALACLGLIARFSVVAWDQMSSMMAGKRVLEQTAAAVNSSSPKLVDEDTRLDGAEVGPSDRFTYLYTLIHLDSKVTRVNEEARTEILVKIHSAYCGGNLKEFQKADVSIGYRYRDRNGLPFTEITVHPHDCH